MQQCSAGVPWMLWEQEGSTHTHTKTQDYTHTHAYMHTQAQLQRRNCECKVLPQACMHMLGASGDKKAANVPHWGQERESYMIGPSIAACRSWHNEFNAIGLWFIWQLCQHLTASAGKDMHTHTHMHEHPQKHGWVRSSQGHHSTLLKLGSDKHNTLWLAAGAQEDTATQTPS